MQFFKIYSKIMKQIIAMVEEDSDDSSEYSDDEDELGNKVGLSYPQKIFC